MSRYARLEVNLIAFFGTVATVLVGWLAGWWAAAPAVVTLALLAFYRDPPRRVPQEAAALLAPADGRVLRVERDAPGPEGGRELRILIFLSIFDVHINRSPCAGQVRAVQYRAGRFHNALRAAASDLNECNELIIEPRGPIPGPVRVRQVAGLLARRIVCAATAGDWLAAGQRFGMIKLGSQTQLCVPEDERWELCVRKGDRVRAGSTVLARLRAGSASAR